MEESRNQVPCLLWPFWFVWQLVVRLVLLTGRLVGVVIGVTLMVLGFVLTVTIIGAFIGIPLMILGLLVTFRSIF